MRNSRERGRRGFSLVEVMVVVLILTVLGMLAVPTVAKLQRRAKTAAIMNDFRGFATAFETYAHESGGWPAETAAGAIPAVMSTQLNSVAWLRKTPMGGQYNWDHNQNHFGTQIRAAIAISAAAGAPLPLDVNQLLDLERTTSPSSLGLRIRVRPWPRPSPLCATPRARAAAGWPCSSRSFSARMPPPPGWRCARCRRIPRPPGLAGRRIGAD